MRAVLPVLLFAILSCTNLKKEIDCKKYTGEYTPVDLFDALDYLDCKWSEDEKNKFKNIPEEDALNELHFGTGLWIRNFWGLWEGENSLVKFFNTHKIYHPDDISSIILKSFHRRLNNIDIDFESQVKYYLNYWKTNEDAEKEAQKNAFDNYHKFKIGDPVSIFLEVDSTELFGELATYSIDPDSESEWIFDPDKDLKIDAILLDKKIIKDSTNIAFVIKIVNLNRNLKTKTYKEFQTKDTIEIEIKYLKIE